MNIKVKFIILITDETMEEIVPKTEPNIKQEYDPIAPKSSVCNEELEILKLLFEKEYEPKPKRQRLSPSPLLERDFQCCICSLNFNKKFILVLHLITVHSMIPAEASAIVEEQLREGQPADKVHNKNPSHVTVSKEPSEIGTRNIPVDIEQNESKLNLQKGDEVVASNVERSADLNWTDVAQVKLEFNPRK